MSSLVRTFVAPMRRLAVLQPQPAVRIALPGVRSIGDRTLQKRQTNTHKKQHIRRNKTDVDIERDLEREASATLERLSQHRNRFLWEAGPTRMRFLDNDDSWEHPLQVLGNVRETPDAVFVSCNIPKGFQKDNVKVQIKDDMLEISGRQDAEWSPDNGEQQTSDEQSGLSATGRGWGRQMQSFQRRVKLPSGCKGSDLKFDFTEDVLEVTVNKAQAAGTQQLEPNM